MAETESRSRRESYLNEILQQRIHEEHQKYRDQFDRLKLSFEFETVKFEKMLKDRAQAVIKTLQIKQLDRLINVVGTARQIQNWHGD